MSKTTYYIVQTGPSEYLHNRGIFGGYDETRNAQEAAHLDIATAKRLHKAWCNATTPETPRRFPRIVKVTVETKTIKDRR